MKLHSCFSTRESRMKLFTEKRFVFVGENPKEANQEAPVPTGQTVDERKNQAYKEIQEIYDLGDYNTYNFRKLPKEFKDHMEGDFKQWVDANVATYDKDKKSGIDANEYKDFKEALTKKVKDVLDRLAQIKKERTEEAKATKETAEEAQERQKSLDAAKSLEAKGDLKDVDSLEKLNASFVLYQENFKTESDNFNKLMGTFSSAKSKVDYANKPHATGLGALKEWGVSLIPWTDDSPEVKEAKAAKEAAIKDFQTKLAEMKKRQKERQAKGKDLNGGPEKIRGKTKDKYKDYRDRTKQRKDEVNGQRDKNKENKEQMIKAREEAFGTKGKVEEQKEAKEKQAGILKGRQEDFDQHAQQVGTYENALSQVIQKLQETIEQTPEPQKTELVDKLQKFVEQQQNVQKSQQQLQIGEEVTQQQVLTLEGGGNAAVLQVGNLSIKIGKIDDAIALCDTNDKSYEDMSKQLDDSLLKIDENEKMEMEQLDKMDQNIADSVLEVDTANFEMITQGESYQKMLYGLDAKGPGVIDTIGAALKPATDWAGEKLSAAWEGIKKIPVIGAIAKGIEAVATVGYYMVEGAFKAVDWVWTHTVSFAIEGIGKALAWVADKIHLQEAFDWLGEASKHMSIGNPTGNPAIDAILDTFIAGGGGAGAIIEFVSGIVEGGKDLIKGVGMMVAHPVEAAKGLIALVNHPSMLTDALLQKDKWHEESTSKIIGRMALDVFLLLAGGGAAGQGVKAAVNGVKLGGMTMTEAALEGLRVAARVFIEDFSKLGKGLVKLPGNILKGTGDLFQTIARGGERLGTIASEGKILSTALEATRGIVKELPWKTTEEQKAAKALAKTQNALLNPESMASYKKVEALKDLQGEAKTAEFQRLLKEDPHIFDKAHDYKKIIDKNAEAAKAYESEMIKSPDLNAENKSAYEKMKAAKADADPSVYQKFVKDHPDLVEKANKYKKVDDAIESVAKRQKIHDEMVPVADAYSDLRAMAAKAGDDTEKLKTMMAEKMAKDPEWYARVKKYENLERDYVRLSEAFEPTRGRPLYPLTLTERIQLHDISLKLGDDVRAFKAAEVEKMTEGLTPAEKELWKRANLDPMTGMYNRNGYLQAEKWVEEGKKITQASVDGDYFSAFNLVKGSEFGDQIIKTMGVEFQKTVAELRKKYPNSNVISIRKGGEEFVVIATDIPEGVMKSAMNELRGRMKKQIQDVCDKTDPGLLSKKGNPGQLETLLDEKGKYKHDPDKPLEIGDSTMAVKEFPSINTKGPPPFDAKTMVENMDTFTDGIMERNKLNKGRGAIYLDDSGIAMTPERIRDHTPASGLGEKQPLNLQGLHDPLAAGAEAKFTNFGKRPAGKKLVDQLDGLPADNEGAKKARTSAVEKIILDLEFNVTKIRDNCKKLGLPDDVTESVLAAKREQLFMMQTTDRLTGVYSKSGIASEIETARDAGIKSYLYELDPLQFKAINEVGGHVGGDTYLMNIANELDGYCASKGIQLGKAGVTFLLHSPGRPITAIEMAEIRSKIAQATKKFFETVDANITTGTPMRNLVDQWIMEHKPTNAAKDIGEVGTGLVTEIPTTSIGSPALRLMPDGSIRIPKSVKKSGQVSTVPNEGAPLYTDATVTVAAPKLPLPDVRRVRAAGTQTDKNLQETENSSPLKPPPKMK